MAVRVGTFLQAGLENLFPDDAFIGEESVARDRALLARLKQPGSS